MGFARSPSSSARIPASCSSPSRIALRDQGIRHDVIQACFELGGQDDLVLLGEPYAPVDKKPEENVFVFDRYGAATDGVSLAVVDQGNNRVLVWTSFPTDWLPM